MLKCDNCSYVGSLDKLYRDKPSAHMGAEGSSTQSWLAARPVRDYTEARQLLTAANIPPLEQLAAKIMLSEHGMTA